jgi:exodeoxyribonuclease VII small subunit
LEQLVGTLEEGELSLEDSLQAYEEGVGLVRRAGGRLDDMDARLEELLQDGRSRALAFGDTGESTDEDGDEDAP